MVSKKKYKGLDGRYVYSEDEMHLVKCVEDYHFAMHDIEGAYLRDLMKSDKIDEEMIEDFNYLENFLQRSLNKKVNVVALFKGIGKNSGTDYYIQWKSC